MKRFRLEDMFRGWFIGNFAPAAFVTEACEVTYKKDPVGHSEPMHYHKVSPEIVLVTKGDFRINNQNYSPRDIVVIEPGEATESLALTDSEIVVVKIPAAKNDKYIGKP